MKRLILILDIDDVIRDLKSNIVNDMNIYYRGENWGEYHYYNPKVREFFEWYRTQSFYRRSSRIPLL